MNKNADPFQKPMTTSRRSVKHRVRSWLDRIAYWTGLLAWCESRMRKGLTILMYHRVLPIEHCLSYPLEPLVIPEDVFRSQMRWLADRCRVLPVREAVVDLNRGGPFDRPLVAVTFDDGYADSYEIIAPILEECGLRGTFFITTGFVEQGKPLWYDIAADAWQRASSLHRQSLIDHFSNNRELRPQSGERPLDIGTWMTALKRTDPTMRIDLVNQAESRASGSVDIDRYRPLTRKQLLELHERGHEIASHSVTHPILPQLSQDELLVELEHSAEYLRNLTKRTVEGFCYPNGDFNDQVESALKQAGYRYACTTQTGLNVPNVCLMRLARLSITMQRTLGDGCRHDAFAFRSELCRLREWWR